MKRIYLIGIGMGNLKTLTEEARQAIEKSNLLIGAKRMIDSFPHFQGETHYAIAPESILDCIVKYLEDRSMSNNSHGNRISGIDMDSKTDSDTITYTDSGSEVHTVSLRAIDAASHNHIISIIFSGDTGFFSGAKNLNLLLEEKKAEHKGLAEYSIELIPGISSLQYFSAKLMLSWEDLKIVSLHGRADSNILGAVLNNKKTFFLTGGDFTVQKICQILVEEGLGKATVHVGERLSYPEERIVTESAEIMAQSEFDPLSVMLVENERLLNREYSTHGLEDERFLRSSVPMTKSEVRSVSLSKLRLRPGDVVYDIGAGTGSAAIDMAFQAYEGSVYAIEVNEEAVRLIAENREKLGAWNVKIINGKAPLALQELPTPDRAFVGGSKGNLSEIIQLLIEKNPGIRVVINAITLETLGEAIKCLNEYGFEDVDIVQISASRSKEVGNYHMMIGQNPVFIISGQGRENI